MSDPEAFAGISCSDGGRQRISGIGPTGQLRLQQAVAESYALTWRTVRALGIDAGEADDALQEVFMILARRLPEVELGKERAFLVQTAIRVASNRRRSNRRRPEVTQGLLEDERSLSPDPEHLVEQKQCQLLLEMALDALPLELRCVFVLFELEQLSSPEIAALLEIPRGTVVSRLRRARERFTSLAANLRGSLREDSRP